MTEVGSVYLLQNKQALAVRGCLSLRLFGAPDGNESLSMKGSALKVSIRIGLVDVATLKMDSVKRRAEGEGGSERKVRSIGGEGLRNDTPRLEAPTRQG